MQEARVVFEVEDTGIGVKPDVLKNLFVPFQQGDSSTSRLFGGSGLGLSISRSLAQLMNGDIVLQSTEGVGTKATFSASFPLAETSCSMDGARSLLKPGRPILLGNGTRPAHRKRSSVWVKRSKSGHDSQHNSPQRAVPGRHAELLQRLPIAERSQIHILLVEDNPVNQLIAVRAIEKLGFSVSAVWNGKEALDYLAMQPSPSHSTAHIVLMDCQ